MRASLPHGLRDLLRVTAHVLLAAAPFALAAVWCGWGDTWRLAAAGAAACLPPAWVVVGLRHRYRSPPHALTAFAAGAALRLVAAAVLVTSADRVAPDTPRTPAALLLLAVLLAGLAVETRYLLTHPPAGVDARRRS